MTLYVTSIKKSPQRYPPVKVNHDEYFAEHHAFLNLGRTPLIDVSVRYSVAVQDRNEPFKGKLDLDCITVDGEAHVAIFVLKTLGRAKITWKTPALQERDELDFYPGKSYTSAATSIPRTRRGTAIPGAALSATTTATAASTAPPAENTPAESPSTDPPPAQPPRTP